MSSPPALLFSLDPLRALLASLKLLQGQRAAGATTRSLLLVGSGASAAVGVIARLEPTLRVTHVRDAAAASGLASFDGALVLQPHHALRARGDLAALCRCLHPEEGALGLLWTRAVTDGRWVDGYTQAASAEAARGAGASSRLPPLAPGASPLTWVDDHLGALECGLKAFKHRKLLERTEPASVAELIAAAQWLHDDARVLDSPAMVAAWVAAAQEGGAAPQPLDLVHHMFSAQQAVAVKAAPKGATGEQRLA